MPKKVLAPARQPRHGLFLLLLFVAALAAYSNSFGTDFLMDSKLLVEDPRVQELTAVNVGKILHGTYWWNQPWAALYRPVTTFSILFNYSILHGITDPAGYHALNFLIHVVNAGLVYWLGVLLFEAAWPAFLTSAVWVVHPAGVEAVTNIAGRADLLATLSLLAALVWYRKRTVNADARPWTTAAVLFLIALFGLLAKENAIVLLGLVALVDLVWFAAGKWPGWSRTWPAYFAVACAAGLFLVLRGKQPPMVIPVVDNPEVAAGFLAARLTATKVIAQYLGILVFPLWLSPDYSYQQVPVSRWTDPGALISLAGLAVLLAVVVWRWRRDRVLFFAAGFFAITLLPVSNLVVIIGSVKAERFLYLPAIGFAIAAAALLDRAGRQWDPRIVRIAAAALVLAFGVRTYARNRDWQDGLSLWSSAVESAPSSYKAHRLLGATLFQQDPERNYETALPQFETAARLIASLPVTEQPPDLANDLGVCYRMKGDAAGGKSTEQGRAWYEKSAAVLERGRESDRAVDARVVTVERARGVAVGRVFGLAELYQNLGNVYLNLGRFDEALEACRYGRLVEPHNPTMYLAIAAIENARGNAEGAAQALWERRLMGLADAQADGQLRGLYSRIAGGTCAFVPDGSGWRLDPSCPRLRQDLCTAAAGLTRMLVQARQRDEARRRLQEVVSIYACPATPLEAVLGQ